MLPRTYSLLLTWLCLTTTGMVFAEDAAPSPEQLEFFEKRVRPLLAEKCLSCHGDKKQEGGLRLDSHAALLKGNDSGPAVVVGKPEASRLIKVLAYSADDLQMPPAGKLAPEQIAILTEWVQRGAIFPGTDKAAAAPAKDPKSHWSFQLMSSPRVPSVKDASRARTEIDQFILSGLDAKGLTLAPEADRVTFIRRLSLDLLGLPPTFAEVQEFIADPRPDAVDQVINRLLASPHYGERWARYWLDIARYGDTKGYVFTEEARYPYAYTYRDYVIDAFNEDKPYDRFIKEQLAADQLNLGDDTKDLAALGFLTVGRRFLNNPHDIIDDRIDVVTRGLMGLTVGCARCHDHKYDPIPTADYYSLYGVFQSSNEPADLPTIGSSQKRSEYEKFAAELAKREKAVADFDQQTCERISAECRTKVTSYLQLLARPTGESPVAAARSFLNGDPRPGVVRRWQEFLKARAKDPDPVFAPWHHAIKAANDFAPAMAEWLHQVQQPGRFEEGADRINRRVRQAFLEEPPAELVDVANVYGQLLSDINKEWLAYKGAYPEAIALPDPVDEELRQVLYGAGTPTVLTGDDARKVYARDDRDKRKNLEKQIETLKVTSAGAPPRAMVMNDNPQPSQPHIFIRGNAGRSGPAVPRQFLAVAAGPDRKPFQRGSGRLDLAEAVVAPSNPLTARVIVNRVWQHHFGKGLVRSHGDFGIRGEEPTHPELLDYLAQGLIKNGWSLKWLHREILTSAVYQQSGQDNPAARAVDPENRLLWKMPRQRLDLEGMRDTWLAASGRLDDTMYGRPFDSITDANSRRRTVYGMVNRNDLPNVFRSFDFANPDASDPERPQTSVPQQTLFALNAPLVREQAKQIAADTAGQTDPSDRVSEIYRRVLDRNPTTEEREMAREYVLQPGEPGQFSSWDRLAQVLLLTNEFLFVD